jgi:hypothetical protein
MICIPAYDCKIDVDCFTSLMGNVMLLMKNGHRLTTGSVPGCCYLDRARNELVDMFLKTDNEYLVFVDSDLAFEKTAIDKLMSVKKPFVFAAYPMKGKDIKWTIKPIGDENGEVTIHPDGTMLCDIAPTGLMKIERRVFTEMKAKHPEWAIKDNPFPFFATGQITTNQAWEGEDVVFCRRYIADGGQCWCYTNIEVDHIGRQHNPGNFFKFISKLEK